MPRAMWNGSLDSSMATNRVYAVMASPRANSLRPETLSDSKAKAGGLSRRNPQRRAVQLVRKTRPIPGAKQTERPAISWQ